MEIQIIKLAVCLQNITISSLNSQSEKLYYNNDFNSKFVCRQQVLSSVADLCKQFGPESGPTNRQA